MATPDPVWDRIKRVAPASGDDAERREAVRHAAVQPGEELARVTLAAPAQNLECVEHDDDGAVLAPHESAAIREEGVIRTVWALALDGDAAIRAGRFRAQPLEVRGGLRQLVPDLAADLASQARLVEDVEARPVEVEPDDERLALARIDRCQSAVEQGRLADSRQTRDKQGGDWRPCCGPPEPVRQGGDVLLPTDEGALRDLRAPPGIVQAGEGGADEVEGVRHGGAPARPGQYVGCALQPRAIRLGDAADHLGQARPQHIGGVAA
ncbi:hypothetical protein CHKEEEPN_4177 [Methylorubrum podarium]|nr:hypothetical protein CHKEEEPN_4177 [Methylorubrum podarium]